MTQLAQSETEMEMVLQQKKHNYFTNDYGISFVKKNHSTFIYFY